MEASHQTERANKEKDIFLVGLEVRWFSPQLLSDLRSLLCQSSRTLI